MASDKKTKLGIRARASRAMLRVPFIRRFYAKRLLSYMEKSREKRRALPEELQDLRRLLDRVPKHMRQATLEQALQGGGGQEEPSSRELRRAVARQQRQSGRHAGRRPGTVMSRQWEPPPPAPGTTKSTKSSKSRKSR